MNALFSYYLGSTSQPRHLFFFCYASSQRLAVTYWSSHLDRPLRLIDMSAFSLAAVDFPSSGLWMQATDLWLEVSKGRRKWKEGRESLRRKGRREKEVESGASQREAEIERLRSSEEGNTWDWAFLQLGHLFTPVASSVWQAWVKRVRG